MPTYYVADADLTEYVAAQMRLVSDEELQSPFGVIVPKANAFAYREIRQRLLARGYRTADIDAWDRREEFALDLGTWFCLRSAASTQENTDWIDKFDRRDELDSIVLTVNDEIVDIVTDNASIRTGQNTYDRQTRESFGGPDAVDYAGGAGWR